MPLSPARLETVARTEIESLLRTLPRPLAARARDIPVLFYPRPTRDMRRDGVEPDTLGLFVGGNDLETAFDDPGPLPPEILVFTQNIWDYAEGDLDAYREEVRVTYYHELGHLLGLEEDDLAARDLD